MKPWKINWEESKVRYADWWNGKGIVLSMWEHLQDGVKPHEAVFRPEPHRDWNQYWFDSQWRADHVHYLLSRSSLLADIPPVANTHLGPGSLAALLGAELVGGEDTIWIQHRSGSEMDLRFNEEHPAWKLHMDLLQACKARAQGMYYIGCPDLCEGLDVLASLRGSQDVLMDMLLEPEETEAQLRQINAVYFDVYDRIYEVIREGDESAFCYFSLWAPGKVAKLQSDISIMISPGDYRRFVQPFIREQCERIDYTLYHLDGVGAQRHVDALLEIDGLNAIQWTPGIGEPQGGDPRWYDLYKRILAGGKSVMANFVTVKELEPLLDHVGNQGLHINVDFKTEQDIEAALTIVERYRG
jgi:hypothetical protein